MISKLSQEAEDRVWSNEGLFLKKKKKKIGLSNCNTLSLSAKFCSIFCKTSHQLPSITFLLLSSVRNKKEKAKKRLCPEKLPVDEKLQSRVRMQEGHEWHFSFKCWTFPGESRAASKRTETVMRLSPHRGCKVKTVHPQPPNAKPVVSVSLDSAPSAVGWATAKQVQPTGYLLSG